MGFRQAEVWFRKVSACSVKIKPGFAGFYALLSLRRALCAQGFSLRTGDHISGRIFAHRRGWIVERLALLLEPERPVPSHHR